MLILMLLISTSNLVNIVKDDNFEVNAQCKNFLLLSETKTYDKVAIGNPPYFQMKKADAIEAGYENYLDVCATKHIRYVYKSFN